MPIPIPTNSPVIPVHIAGLIIALGPGGWGANSIEICIANIELIQISLSANNYQKLF